MKTTVDRKELARALTLAGKAISRRNTLPVLSGIKITANGRLEVAATDLELTIVSEVDCYSETDGAAIAPSRDLLKLVKAQRDGNVTLEADVHEITVNGARIKAMTLADYPILPVAGGLLDTFTWDAQELRSALSRALVAVSTDDTRQVLTGVFFHGERGEFAATDSYRLAVQAFAGANPGGEYVIPARACKQVVAAIGKKTEIVKVSFSEHLISFAIGDTRISTRLIEGQYVNYRQLLPENQPNTLRSGKAAFLETLAMVSPMAQNNLPVKLELKQFTDHHGTCTISAHTPDVGEAEETMNVTYQGEAMVIAFNPEFLEDGIEACPEVSFTMTFTDGLKPAKIQADDCGFTYLLMPVRLS